MLPGDPQLPIVLTGSRDLSPRRSPVIRWAVRPYSETRVPEVVVNTPAPSQGQGVKNAPR
jgi:hypothetical protein